MTSPTKSNHALVCRYAKGLTDASFANTLISGTIPDELKELHFLHSFNILNTRMFCCGNNGKRCTSTDDPDCLPAFLQFDSDTMVPPPLDLSLKVQAKEAGDHMK